MKFFIILMIITTPAWALWVVREKSPAAAASTETQVITKIVQRVEIIGKSGEPQWVDVEITPTAIPEPSVVPMFLLPALALLLRRKR